jgi:mono/diheme cytochrome c family protein
MMLNDKATGRRPQATDVALLIPLCVACLAACQVADRGETAAPSSYALGTTATAAEIAALDLDVSPSGAGLPQGLGDAVAGERIYQAQCASCHGAKGEGVAPYPALVGREPREGFSFGNDPKLVRTVGNYWPSATGLFDYIRRTMPLTAPGTLANSEVYAVTAYLLVANEILPAGATLDSTSLMVVSMPAKDRFVPDNRRGGREVRE